VAHASADRRRAAGGAIDLDDVATPPPAASPRTDEHPTGFDEVYGDYGEIVITGDGHTIGVWGEGTSYHGPGGVWFDRQT
jgi:hypothetical protein